MPGLYSHTTRATGTILTASIYNTDHQNHIDNQTLQMTDDFSTDLAQSRTQVDPATLATSADGEISRLRFIIAKIAQVTNWDQALALVKKAGDTITGALTVSGGSSPTSLTAANLGLGGGGVSPVGATIAFGDNTGWRLDFGTIVASAFTRRFSITDTGAVAVVTGPLTGVAATFTGLVTGAGFTGSGNVGIIPAAVSGTPAQHGLFRENVLKAWVDCGYAGSINDSFNVASITDNGVGLTTVTWDRDFAAINYAVTYGVAHNGVRLVSEVSTARAVGSIQLSTVDTAFAAADGSRLSVNAVGDQ
jgi:hypothetical protein